MILEGLVNWDRNSDEFVIEILTSLMFCAFGHRMGFGEKSCMGFGDGVHVCFTDSTDRRACMFHRTS